MPLVDISKDTDALTLTVVTEYAVTPERMWQLWADKSQLERWWGPPTWPATFERLDLTVGGEASYYMTGPNGEKARAWWRFTAVEEPRLLEYVDGFSDDSGSPDPQMPTMHVRVDFEPVGDSTRMTVTTRFESVADMEQLAGMGIVEGMTEAIGQIDAILAG